MEWPAHLPIVGGGGVTKLGFLKEKESVTLIFFYLMLNRNFVLVLNRIKNLIVCFLKRISFFF